MLSRRAVACIGPRTGARSVQSIWGSFTLHSSEPHLTRVFTQSKFRSFDTSHVPELDTLGCTTEEQYLLSAIKDDTQRLLKVDWTYDFDPFWADRVDSHARLFEVLYFPDRNRIRRMFVGSASPNSTARKEIEASLNYLKEALRWAMETEKNYTAIVNERYAMQRAVFDALEREKILAGCADLCERFKLQVPNEFRRKATTDLEAHLGNMRHWVWDCPNAKMHFPRKLA
jgi:hypothetical protein